LYVNKREAKCTLLIIVIVYVYVLVENKYYLLTNCAALAAALFITLIENLRLCSSAEARLFFNFE